MAPSLQVIRRGIIYAILFVGALVMLLPLFEMTLGAFKPLAEVMRVPPTWLPEQPTLDNFSAVFRQVPFAHYLANSIIVSTVCVASVVVTSSAAGYALAKFQFRGNQLILMILLSSLMVPFQTRMIALFQLTVGLHIDNTILGVVFPWLVDAFGIFLIRQYMLSIPNELIEAARIDGAGELRILLSVVMPLARPALAAVAIMTFLSTWEEFLWPLIVTNDDTARTIPVGLQLFSGQYITYINYQMAGGLIATIPLLAVFILFQRQIITGIAMTGLKG